MVGPDRSNVQMDKLVLHLVVWADVKPPLIGSMVKDITLPRMLSMVR
jgi:hypothetical protein